jgi:hypothetical protein
MDTAPAFDALIKFRTHKKVKARLDRIARHKGKQRTEVYREAAAAYGEQEERLINSKAKAA